MKKAVQNNLSNIAAVITHGLTLNHRKLSVCIIQRFFNYRRFDDQAQKKASKNEKKICKIKFVRRFKNVK